MLRATGGPNGIYNVINCTGVTTPEQTLSIAHMDFSADGNATSPCVGADGGPNVRGTVHVIHDGYFVFDLGDGSNAPNQTYRSTGSTGYNWWMFDLTLRSNVFEVRDADRHAKRNVE